MFNTTFRADQSFGEGGEFVWMYEGAKLFNAESEEGNGVRGGVEKARTGSAGPVKGEIENVKEKGNVEGE